MPLLTSKKSSLHSFYLAVCCSFQIFVSSSVGHHTRQKMNRATRHTCLHNVFSLKLRHIPSSPNVFFFQNFNFLMCQNACFRICPPTPWEKRQISFISHYRIWGNPDSLCIVYHAQTPTDMHPPAPVRRRRRRRRRHECSPSPAKSALLSSSSSRFQRKEIGTLIM